MSTKSFGPLYDPNLLLLQHILSICKYYILQIYFLSKIGVLQLRFLIFMYILLLLVLKCKNTTRILQEIVVIVPKKLCFFIIIKLGI